MASAGAASSTSGSIVVRDGVDSPSGSGFKSVVSDPLDGIASYDTLWKELLEVLKNPTKQFAIKESKCTIISDCEFSVTQYLDGKVLRATGKGNLAGEDEENTYKYVLDKARGTIMAEVYGKAGRIRDRNWGILHRDPVVLEWWGETPGQRKSGNAKAKQLQNVLEAIIKRVQPDGFESGKLQVNPDVVSSPGSGLKSAISSPLDKFIDFEKLWNGFIHECKSGGEVQVTSPTTFTAVQVKGGNQITISYQLTKEKGEVYSEHFGPRGRIFERMWTVFHKSPLYVECYGEAAGERKSGKAKAAYVQSLVDSVVVSLRAKSGTGSKVKASPNCMSPSAQGLLSVVSEPLGKHIEFQKLWEDWVALLKSPLRTGEIKSSEVTVISDTEFKVVNTLDEDVLVSRTPGRRPREDERNYVKYFVNKGTGTIRAETYGMGGRLRDRDFAVVHKNPLRLEWWGENPGERKFGAGRATEVQSLLNTILRRGQPQGAPGPQVKVNLAAPSPANASLKSVVTDSLEGLTTFEKFWAELVDMWKYPQKVEGTRISAPTVVSDSEFSVAKTLETGEVTIRYLINKVTGEARLETYGKAGRIRDRNSVILHRGPLRLEWWGELPGERKFGQAKCAMVQRLLDSIIAKVNPRAAAEASPALKAAFNAESPSVPWLKSVVTEPMDRFVDYDRFWQELIQLLQHPPSEPGGLKDSKLTERSPSEFVVERRITPPALKSTVSYKINKPQSWIYSETFGPDGNLQQKDWLYIHKEPLMVEAWGEAQIQRKFGPARRGPMQSMVDQIMKRVLPNEAGGKVKVNSSAKVKSVVSGDLGKFMDFERLWTELVHISKYPPKTGILKGTTLTQTSESEFQVVQTLQSQKGKGKGKGAQGSKGKGKGAGGEVSRATLKYKLNKKRGEMYREAYGQLGKLTEKVWVMIRKGPLRVESWAETPGTRKFGRDKAGQIQAILDEIIK